MNTRAIIIAAGEATRWKDYLGVKKHFIEIDGEPIIKRAVRLLRKNGVEDIHVVGRTEEYKIEGSSLYVPNLNPENHDADKFLSSKELWNKTGRTLVVYGDVYFSDKAMEIIIREGYEKWMLFGRAFHSFITGGSGECFAQSFYPEMIEKHEQSLYKLIEYFNEGTLDRIGGWEHYRMMIGVNKVDIRQHIVGPGFFNIDDWTDDFDEPSHYDGFMSRRKEACFVCQK